MLKFIKLKFRNFMSYGKKDGEIFFGEKTLTLISGCNGVGKSTLFRALYFGLYGTSNNKILKQKLINIRNKKDLMVEVELINNEGKNIIIQRGIRPNKLKLYINGILQNEESSVKYDQAYIEEEIIKIPSHIFKQIILLSVNDFKSFFELKIKDKRLFLSNILQLDKIDIWERSAMDILKKFTEELKELEIKNITLEKIVKDSEKRLSGISKIDNQRIDDISKEILTIKDKISNLQKINISKLKDEKQKLLEEIDLLNHNTYSDKAELNYIFDYDKCEKCPLKDHQDWKITIDDKKEKSKGKEIQLKTSIKENGILIEKKNKEAKNYEKLIKEYDNLNIYNDKVKSLENELDNSETINKLYNGIFSEIENNTNETEKNRAQITKLIKYIRLFEFLKSDFFGDGGIKLKYFIRQIIPIINKIIFDYLIQLDAKFLFKFDGDLKEVIKISGEDIDYENLSEGQKLKLKMALVLAFRDLLKVRHNKFTTNIFIIDELIDSSMDTESSNTFLNIIKDKVKDEQTNIYIISHNSIIMDNPIFDEVYNIVLEKGFSKIIKGGN